MSSAIVGYTRWVEGVDDCFAMPGWVCGRSRGLRYMQLFYDNPRMGDTVGMAV